MNKLKNYNPEFKSVNDAIAFAIHLAFLESNCQLVGLNENQYLEDIGSIPAGWNKSNQMYAFRYILKSEKGKNDNNNKNDKNNNNNKNNNEKAKKEAKEEKKQDNGDDNNKGPCYLVKILSLGNDLLMASGVKQGTNDISTLDITISDHLSVDSKQANKDKSILKNYEKLYKNLNSLLLLIKDSIVDKVIPSKEKENDKSKEKDKNNDKNKNKKNILIDDDDFPGVAPIGPIGGGIGPIGGGIGGGIRPGGDFGGDIGGDFGGIGGMGGNWMGPNHGRFQNPNANNNNNNNNNGGIGGMVPPGAKYDPPGPGPLGGGHIGPDPDHEQMPGRNNQDWLGGGGIGQGFGARRQQPRGGGGFGGFGGGGGGFGGFV